MRPPQLWMQILLLQQHRACVDFFFSFLIIHFFALLCFRWINTVGRWSSCYYIIKKRKPTESATMTRTQSARQCKNVARVWLYLKPIPAAGRQRANFTHMNNAVAGQHLQSAVNRIESSRDAHLITCALCIVLCVFGLLICRAVRVYGVHCSLCVKYLHYEASVLSIEQ